MVPLVCTWHVHHEPAWREIERRLARGEEMCLAAPALLETYAVLTRLPRPNRLAPIEGRAVLEAGFLRRAVRTVSLDVEAYQDLLLAAPDRQIAGGAIFDAVIIACALTAGADAILTFNERQFRFLAPPELEVVVPS
jgi:predicted nucleic acid-binding protein